MRDMISEQQIEQNKQTIIALLQGTNRQGIDNVISYLNTSGFFTIPSSTDRHHNWRGGLAEHALGVYKAAKEAYSSLAHDSLVIACLLHDLCKARQLCYDNQGRLHRNHHLHIKGHGRRSVKLIKMLGLKITNEERIAIRWHMGGHHCTEWIDMDEVMYSKRLPLAIAVKHGDRLDASRHQAIF